MQGSVVSSLRRKRAERVCVDGGEGTGRRRGIGPHLAYGRCRWGGWRGSHYTKLNILRGQRGLYRDLYRRLPANVGTGTRGALKGWMDGRSAVWRGKNTSTYAIGMDEISTCQWIVS